MISVQLKKNKL